MDGVTALAGLWTAGRLGLRTVTTASSVAVGGAGMALAGVQAAWGGMRSLAGAGGSGASDAVANTATEAPGRRYPGGTLGGGAPAGRTGGTASPGWDRPMTDAQRAELDRLAEDRTYDEGLSRGQASRLIEDWGGDASWCRGAAPANPSGDKAGDPPRAEPGRRESEG